MEHIWQSSQQHASGAFDIAEDLTVLRPASYLGAVFTFPIPNSIEKPLALCVAFNSCHLKEDLSQLSGIGRFGRSPAPRQSLPLDMDEASLDCDTRPELTQGIYNIGITINCKTTRAQPLLHKRSKEGHELGLRAFREGVSTGYDLGMLSIHQGNEAARAVKESPVQDEVLALPQAKPRLWRRLFQIVVNHTIKLCRAVPALVRQLSNRITFSKPKPEPLPLSCAPCPGIAPAKRLPARGTKPALLSVSIVTISLQNS